MVVIKIRQGTLDVDDRGKNIMRRGSQLRRLRRKEKEERKGGKKRRKEKEEKKKGKKRRKKKEERKGGKKRRKEEQQAN